MTLTVGSSVARVYYFLLVVACDLRTRDLAMGGYRRAKGAGKGSYRSGGTSRSKGSTKGRSAGGRKGSSKGVRKTIQKRAPPNKGKGKGRSAVARPRAKGRGKGQGRVKKAKGRGKSEEATKENLDKELEDYMGPDAVKVMLDKELETYFASATKVDNGAAPAVAAAGGTNGTKASATA
eukprot:TRINITY_DN30637_c0_g1_i1.p1 TRINITY_DN30637_c0_g1~~TRINITY_DN30637_c0_g1_i1.p1  ORF type:complete len:179 (-),score=40.32 TRINITY_DN30637_c0_g1_i1:231-767(-)